MITTVEDLITELRRYPLNMKVIGYDGSDKECGVDVYQSCFQEDGLDLDEVVIISLD